MSTRSGGLLERALGALFIIPFGAGLLVWPYGTIPLTGILILLAAREGAQIIGSISGGASAAWSAALLVGPMALFVIGDPLAAAIWWVLTLLSLVSVQLLRALRMKRGSVAPIAQSLVGTLATATWLSPLVILPILGWLRESTPAPWITWLLAVVWSADTGAYLIGRRFGKRKLAPLISPRKSVEGLIGGLFTATLIGGLVAANWLSAPLIWALPASFAVAAAAEAGDLVESMFKRAAGTKNSATLIPGHGGVLDRIDSLLLAAPVALLAAIALELSRTNPLGN
ncbi:MAG: phosphatidate cytidylyltransferase [Chloroflexota bacterium]|jgi:phosphatidate cytidylyltransferase